MGRDRSHEGIPGNPTKSPHLSQHATATRGAPACQVDVQSLGVDQETGVDVRNMLNNALGADRS